jgi:hypothetical protein
MSGVLTVGAVAFIVSAGSASGSATFGGNATLIAAPASVQEHVLTDPNKIFVFFESEHILSASQTVDQAAPGSFDDYNLMTASSVPAGTCVDSWLMQFDPGGLPFPNTAQSDGSVTFDTKILGMDVLDNSLDATDASFGSPTTTYPTGTLERGLEVLNAPSGFTNRSGNPDSFSIDTLGTTAGVHMDTGAHFDQVRVFTQCVPTVSHVIAHKAIVGATYTLKASVSSAQNGIPSGTVDFYVDSTLVGSNTLDPKGKTSITIPVTWTIGKHTATAIYEGDPPTHGTSTSKAVTFTTV